MTGTVVVGCKLPNGLILHVFNELDERVQIGMLRGTAVRRDPEAPPAIFHHGAALTRVDADGFAKWWEQNKAGPLVREKAVFYQDTEPKAASEAREYEKIKPVSAPVTVDDASKSNVRGVTDLAKADLKDV